MTQPEPFQGSLAWRLRYAHSTCDLEGAAFSPDFRNEFTRKELLKQLRASFVKLRVSEAFPEAQKWWRKFVKQHRDNIPAALKLCNDILSRGGTAEDYYFAFRGNKTASYDAILEQMGFHIGMRKYFEAEPTPWDSDDSDLL